MRARRSRQRRALMPELPEVEVVRRGLEARVLGRTITRVDVGRERTVRRTSREALIAGLTGTALTAAGRRGKYLICPLDSGDSVMIHLRMSGQLRLVPSGSPRPLHTHVAMELSGGEELRFIDPRTFGEVVVFDPSRADAEVPELARLGPDPMVDGLTARALRVLVRGRSRPIKGLLLDQHAVAGLGNIYSDEVLHAAGVRFDRPAGSLRPQEVARLHQAIGDILGAAIEAGGSTLPDARYVGLSGQPGRYQQQHRVYGREGGPCLRCGARSSVTRARYVGRSTFFCPRCQR
jgi:formamidopyrimidine-DNA glycosylase